MANIGIFVGSCNKITMDVAKKIHESLGEDNCDLFDLEDDYSGVEDFLAYDTLLFGCSTWGSGDVQRDWVEPLEDIGMEKPDFAGKTIALFGAGDCINHGEQFVSALGVLYDRFSELGASFIGSFPTDGYDFEYSAAVRDGVFVGFPFDQVNQNHMTKERLGRWLEKLKSELP